MLVCGRQFRVVDHHAGFTSFKAILKAYILVGIFTFRCQIKRLTKRTGGCILITMKGKC